MSTIKEYCSKLTSTLVAGSLLAFSAGSAYGNTVTFDNINDANLALFDSGTTAPDGMNPNKLVIGLDNFSASASGGGTVVSNAYDTIAFDIVAPTNYVITRIDYVETGATNRSGNGATIATGSWTVGGITSSFDSVIGTSPTTNFGWSFTPFREFDVSEGLTDVAVSITNQITAFAVNPGDSASIEKTGASVLVTLTLVPIPPAFLLFGSAVVGLLVVGRRRKASSGDELTGFAA
jgi:hypothetical protein